MSIASSYKQLNKTIQTQYLEPSWGWGFRVAISVTVPLIWGLAFHDSSGAEWMAIAAECVSFIELKGNVGQRVRILLSAMVLSILFCIVGSIAGNFFWLSLIGMFVVGFVSGTFKNLGERGMGLALSIYIFYIIASAYPTQTSEDLWNRCLWVSIGSVWTVIVGLASFLFIRIGTPYRRTIATIWKAVAGLANITGKGWDGTVPRSSIRDIYLKERDVRNAIDSSLHLFEETTDMVSKEQKQKYALTQSRKIASLVSLHIIQLSELTEQSLKVSGNRLLSMQFHTLYRVLEQLGDRMHIFLLTLKNEERLIVDSRIERLRKVKIQLEEDLQDLDSSVATIVKKINVLIERIAKLVERSLELLTEQGENRIYRTYSFTQTLNILHPKYLKNNLKQLLDLDRATTRYALRIGVATFTGTLIGLWLAGNNWLYKYLSQYFDTTILYMGNHGYWIPFTAIIVSQPYIGATVKKGIDRSVGTLAGIIVGTLLLMLPFPQFFRLLMVFFSSVFLIYFLRKKYSVSAFFITLMLVGLLAIDAKVDYELMIVRLIATIIGSFIAITAGFMLLPSWDKNLFPSLLTKAMFTNFKYFQNTFYAEQQPTVWTKLKKLAETANGNAFDSFTRFMQEPAFTKKKGYTNYYYLLTHVLRVTRELNNFNNEAEFTDNKILIKEKENFYQLINQCDELLRENCNLLNLRYKDTEDTNNVLKTFPQHGIVNMHPTEAQFIYLEKLQIELRAINTGLKNSQ